LRGLKVGSIFGPWSEIDIAYTKITREDRLINVIGTRYGVVLPVTNHPNTLYCAKPSILRRQDSGGAGVSAEYSKRVYVA
jgi:hypothetical protein